MDNLAGRRKKGGKSMKLGGGGRFAALSAKMAGEGVSDPDAAAAAVGRRKYGKKKMGAMAAKGRRNGGADKEPAD